MNKFLTISLCVIILSNMLSYTKQDVMLNPQLVEFYKIRQIQKGINEELPGLNTGALIEYRVYEPETMKLINKGTTETSISSTNIPKCVEETLNYMSRLERVSLDCPSNLSFTNMNAHRFPGVKEEERYIIDFQVWKLTENSQYEY